LASIQGVEFSVEALSYLLGVDDHAVLQHLETIADRYRLIMECAARHIGSKMLTVFRFRNRSIQQYAHTQVRKLPELHKQVGEFLEHFCENKEKMKADIAGGLFEHFRISQQWDKSFNYAVQAAYRALERDQVRKAFWFFHCAVEMIPKVPGAEHIKPKLEEKLRKAGWDSRSRIDLAYCGPKLPCMMSPRLMGAYPDYTKINYKDLCEYVE